MTYLTKISEVEIHPTVATADETDKRWSVKLYGDDVNELYYVDSVDIKSKHTSGFKNPESDYSDAFSYVVFEKPVGANIEENKLILQ